MKVLVLGGTGVMGCSLVGLLSAKGNVVFVTSRNYHISTDNVFYWQCNARSDSFLHELKQYHFDAIIDFMGYKTDEFAKRVKILLDVTDHYIFLSSARVYAASNSPLTEDSPLLLNVCQDKNYLRTDEYALAKARQELLLRESGKYNWTIIRPYITYGYNRLQLEGMEKEEWLYRAMKGRTVIVSEDMLDKVTTLTSADDVAECLAMLVGNAGAKNETFLLTGGDNMTWRDILSIYGQTYKYVTGQNMKIKFIKKAEGCHYDWAKYQVKYDRMYTRLFNNHKILQYKAKDFTPMQEGLSRSLLSFLHNPQFKRIDWVMEAKKDRISGEITSLSEIRGFMLKLRYLYHRFSID